MLAEYCNQCGHRVADHDNDRAALCHLCDCPTTGDPDAFDALTGLRSEQYNGWTNRETWCVNLWLSNDPDTYADATMEARELRAVGAHHDKMRDWVEEAVIWPETVPADLATDLLMGALSRVDWRAIVEALAED